jgi:hypothetical protein
MGPPHAYDFKITSYGFDQFIQVSLSDYGKLCADVARLLVRSEDNSNFDASQELKQPIRIIDHIFETLKHNGLIKSSETIDGTIHVYWVSPELRRKLDG